MANIERASELMGAVDTAAQVIDDVLSGEMSKIVDELRAEKIISNIEAESLKRTMRGVGASVSGKVLGLHARLTERAQQLGIDVPPPNDGRQELISRVNSQVSVLGGGR